MVDENSKVRDWYVEEFPEDGLGKEIPETLTFYDIFKALDTHKDVYELLTPADDSVIRERVFQKLSDIMGIDYEEFYNKWLMRESEEESIKESSAEEYWNSTSIKRDGFCELLKFNFGSDSRGNNYIITIDCNEAERFHADSDEEAIKIYEDWKKAKNSGAVEYDFNNSYKKIVETSNSKDLKESSDPIHAPEAMCGFIADLFYNEAEGFSSNEESLTDWCEGGDTFRNASYSEDLCKVLDEMLVKLNPKIQEINAILKEYDY